MGEIPPSQDFDTVRDDDAGPGRRETPRDDAGSVDHIGRFRILRDLGRGGQGFVRLAVDERLGRTVALKVLTRAAGFSAAARARFLREAELASRLDHPGICTVHDAGEDDGVPWIAMRYIEGETLTARLRRLHAGPEAGTEVLMDADSTSDGTAPVDDRDADGARFTSTMPDRRTVDEFVQIVEKAARALHVAHEAGLVHRDVKPGNLMIAPSGDPVVLDFGLARADDAETATLTQTGEVMGTPAYMAPEQIRGDTARIDRRSDVWALGVILYECLAGRRPFAAPTRAGLQRAIEEASPPDLRRINPAVSADLAVVVATAMDGDPDRRYRSAAQLADDLLRVRQRLPIRARPISPGLRLLRWTQRNPSVAASAAAAFALVLAVAAVLFVKNRQLASRQVELTRAFEDRSEALAEYQRMADLRRLARARAEADALWPAGPEMVAPLEAWLERHRGLVERLPAHGEALAASRARAEAQGRAADDDLLFRLESLERLVADLADFADTRRGVVRSVVARLALSRELERRSIEEPREEWEAAAHRIAGDPRFDGLRLAPIVGLLPLGADPESGLEEFLDLRSHEGALPRRDAGDGLEPALGQGLILVLVPGGEFLMGAQREDPAAPRFVPDRESDEVPVHAVALEPFLLGKWEVTQDQWRRLTGDEPSAYAPGFIQEGAMTAPVSPLHPVERVSWEEARRVLARLALDLPTEARWERAARADGDTPWAGASTVAELGRTANLAGLELQGILEIEPSGHRDPFVVHAPVGSFRPNAFGLHDMTGNVAEWCLDVATSYELPPAAGDGARLEGGSARIFRGGAAQFAPRDARVGLRGRHDPRIRADYIGLRAARSLRP